MKTIHARPPVDCSHLMKKHCLEEHADIIIDEPTRVLSHDGAHTIAVFDNVSVDSSELLEAVQSMRYAVDWRTDGMQSRSRTFGAQPRIPLRRNFCTVASSVREHPSQHRALERWGQYAADFYERHEPERAQAQRQTVERDILPDWRMANGLFTSGIVNQTVELWYHRDAGNLRDAWSTMIVLSDACRGGLTVFPEYGIAFKYDGAQVITFNGAAVLHGVTKPSNAALGYRYSCVWYAVGALQHCGTPAEEVDRIRKLKTEAERNRHTRNKGELVNKIKNKKGKNK